MTEKQEHLLQLFRELDEICKKNNLRYVMAGGTAIGVVRNEGFIPWDDDVDIYMPRDDWNKLVEISGSVLPEHRALQCVDVWKRFWPWRVPGNLFRAVIWKGCLNSVDKWFLPIYNVP